MQQSNVDDNELMEQIARGHEASLDEIYDRYSQHVYAVCHRMLRSRHDAEEVTLDVFQELWQRPSRFNPSRSSPRTYIMRIAHSRAIDRLRWNSARKIEGDGQHELEDVPAWGETPANQVVLDEAMEALTAALKDLKPQQRLALELAYFDGLSHREIAERLDLPLGSVKTSIRQAVSCLKKALRAEHGT